MAGQSQEIKDALEKQENENRLAKLEATVLKLTQERDRAVLWGLGVVGSSFLFTVTLIFNYAKEHLTK